MPSESPDMLLVVKKEMLPQLRELMKENDIRTLQDLFEGGMALIVRYLQAINQGRRFMEVDEKTEQVFELNIDWKSPRRPTLTILKGGRK
jgi:hypothetical protein